MNNLIWIGKENSNRGISTDVSISMNKNGKNKMQAHFRFRNNCFLRFTKNNYVEFAVTGARIYFRESNQKNGYRLTCKSKDGKACSFKTGKDLSKIVGDYELLWDCNEKLNYIDFGKRIIL